MNIKEERLSLLLKATSDATRRKILTTLVQQGECKVTQLAQHFDVSLNAVSKHIKVLENAGLIDRKTVGRVHLITANLTSLKEIEHWFDQLKSIWDIRLDHFESILEDLENE